jgi:hypothetical protein
MIEDSAKLVSKMTASHGKSIQILRDQYEDEVKRLESEYAKREIELKRYYEGELQKVRSGLSLHLQY